MQVPTIHQAVSSRRLGLLKRVLDSNSEWLLGLIVDSWDFPKGWTNELRKELEWLAKLETGVTPTGTKLMAQAKESTKKRWKARIKTATAGAILMKEIQDDLGNLEKSAGGLGINRTKNWSAASERRLGMRTVSEVFCEQTSYEDARGRHPQSNACCTRLLTSDQLPVLFVGVPHQRKGD